MVFNYELFPRVSLIQNTQETGITYDTPDGLFPSVTTVLSRHFGKEGLDAWRKRVGEAEADAISLQATRQGTAFHQLCEDFLKQEKSTNVIPTVKSLFLKIKPFLEKNLTTVYGIEHPLYSANLKTAGTADLLGQYFGKFNAVTDFKTSRRLPIYKDAKLKYAYQATIYALMAEELYGVKFPYNIIIVACPSERDPVINIECNYQYRDIVRRIFNEELSV